MATILDAIGDDPEEMAIAQTLVRGVALLAASASRAGNANTADAIVARAKRFEQYILEGD